MMGTTMDNSSCEWVRGRLPLSVGAGDGLRDSGDDRDELAVEDRRTIERHLAECSGCREHRVELAGAMGALAAVAGALPVATNPPSLWPVLERRIAAGRAHGDSARARKRDPALGAGPTWADLDDERPLQSAWLQDTLREVAEAVGFGARPERSARPGRDRSRWSTRGSTGSWRVAGVSLAASVLMLLTVMPVAWRLRAVAEAKMLANAVPVAPLVGPPAPTGSEVAGGNTRAPAQDRDIDDHQLARAEPIKPPAEPSTASDGGAGGKPGASRFGYDLEHVTPMPPEGRDSKPVY
jgi:hypothetical protein